MQNNKKMIYADDLLSTLRDDPAINGANLRRVIQHINDENAVNRADMRHLSKCIAPSVATNWVLKVGNMDGLMVTRSP